jgi:hypothetical protein
MGRLRKIGMLSVDPAGARVAVRVPEWMEAQPGTVVVKFWLRLDAQEAAQEQETDVTLVEREERAELRALAGETRPGTHFLIFRASDADVARLQVLRAQVRAEKVAHPDVRRQGPIAWKSRGCRLIEPAQGPIMVDIYLSTGDGDGFQDVDLRELQKPGETFETSNPPRGKLARKAR